ncbi:MAG TPA: alpha/beta hydrolase [Terriglobia bacterium]|nr:alpha/beta hydrolase [Terriglobia bacterium]
MKMFLRIIRFVGLISLATLLAFSQTPTPRPAKPAASDEPQTFPLWENGAPGALGHEDSDIPTLTYYPAMQGIPTAIVVAPGGGYRGLAINHEGRQIANWLNAAGISAFVLKYRLGPRYHHPIELGDAQRAIRLVRTRAADYGLKPDHIGMMGFSAGGHLTSTAETHFDSGNASAADPIDRASSRPDFAILGYPVISFTAPYTHKGSAQALLGDSPDPKLLENLSSDLQVTPHTPPTFLFSTSADTGVPPENSVAFYLALHKANVPAELHIFQKGPHGVGLDLSDVALGEWPKLLINWLRGLGLLEK